MERHPHRASSSRASRILLVKVRINIYDKARDLVRLDRFEKKECSSKINSSCGGRCLSNSRSFNVLRSLAIPYCFYRTFNRRNDTLGMTLNPVVRMECHRGASSPTASASLFRRIRRAAGIIIGSFVIRSVDLRASSSRATRIS